MLLRAPRQGEEKNRAVTSNAYMYEKPDANDKSPASSQVYLSVNTAHEVVEM